MDELRKIEGLRKYGVDKQHNQLQLMSSFVAAVRGHIEKRVGLAFGNGRLHGPPAPLAHLLRGHRDSPKC
jgi:hypothetical protein